MIQLTMPHQEVAAHATKQRVVGAYLLALGPGPRLLARHSGALCSVRQQPTGSSGRLQGWGKAELAVIGPQEPAVNFTAVLCSPRM